MSNEFFPEASMKRILVSLIFLMSVLPVAQPHADDALVKKEAMLILLAGFSAAEPETAAAVDVLALLVVPSSSEYKNNTQRAIAYVGLSALAFYNNDAEDNDYTEEEIFAVNLLVFNIVLAGDLFGFGDDDDTNNFMDVEEPGGSFNFQLAPTGRPEVSWRYRF